MLSKGARLNLYKALLRIGPAFPATLKIKQAHSIATAKLHSRQSALLVLRDNSCLLLGAETPTRPPGLSILAFHAPELSQIRLASNSWPCLHGYPAAATGQISKASPRPDLGSTVDYLTAKYGKPVKVEKAWCGGTAYGFRPAKMTYVYAIETNGVVGDVTYFDFDKPQLTQENSVRLFRSQFPIFPEIKWADKEHKKGLGQEKGKHWTHTQWIVESAMVLHEGKSFISNPKDKGWQFRTPEQFWAEQAVIKALKKELLEKEKAKRTPRKKSGTSKASAS